MKVNVPERERAAYLANVLSIAKADGVVSRDEAIVVRAILDKVGADESDLIAARDLIGDGRYRLQLLSSPALCMANAQDMIMVALADDDASGIECEPIERVAAALKYSQADIDIITRRAEAELHQMRRNSESGKTSRPVFDSPPPPPPLPPPPPPPAVPKAATVLSPPVPEGRSLSEKTTDTLRQKGVSRSAKQAQREAGLAGTSPLSESAGTDMRAGRAGKKVSSVAVCKACRETGQSGAAYCFGAGGRCINVWGCRLARMDWDADADWFELGSFRDDDVFVFDKGAIAARLSSALSAVLGCVYLNTQYAEAAFDVFPVRARAWGRWEYRRADEGEVGARKVVVARDVHGCSVSVCEDVTGVVPSGVEDGLLVIRDALKRSGRSDVGMGELRKVFRVES